MAAPDSAQRRLAVVTGAASGVGLATVRALRGVGTAVVGLDLAGAPTDLAEDHGVDWVVGDVAAEASWEEARSRARAREPGGADCLVCCAGQVTVGPLLENSPDDWRRLLEVNLLGVVHGLRTLIPDMVARREGAVAVVASMNAIVAEVEAAAYSSSKAALVHATRGAALEYAPYGLQINAVLPGCVDTPMLTGALDASGDAAGARRALERRTPIGRLLRPEEIAGVLRFLVSREASGMSGAAVVVDGGITVTYDFVPPVA